MKKLIKLFILSIFIIILLPITVFFVVSGNVFGKENNVYTEYEVTFNEGVTPKTIRDNDQYIDESVLFDEFTNVIDTTSSDSLILPGSSFSSFINNVKLGDDYILDSETFYFNDPSIYYINDLENINTLQEGIDVGNIWAYTFTGWHISGALEYIPSVTVFQPGDVITDNILEEYATDGKLVLEALWGKVHFVRNKYENMVYKKNSSNRYALDEENSFGLTSSDDSNLGNDPLLPKATIDESFKQIRTYYTNGNKSLNAYDAYQNVIMLTGNVDYLKDTNLGSSYNYFGYGSDELVKSVQYTSVTFKSFLVNNVTLEKDDSVVYTLFHKPVGYGPRVYCNLRFDNIKFEKPANNIFESQSNGVEFQLYNGSSYSSGPSYIEFTNRYASKTSSTTSISTLRPNTHKYVIINGGSFSGLQLQYSSSDKAGIEREWYIGRSASINTVTLGTTSAYVSNVSEVYSDFNVYVTGGTVTTFYGASAGMNSISIGSRIINVLGNGTTNREYNPKITNFYGGANASRLFGDININIRNCNNIGTIYGGGNLYTATTYGDITINLENSLVSSDLYGGGKNGNTEVTPATYLKYTSVNGEYIGTVTSVSVLSGNVSSRIGRGGTVNINLKDSTVNGNIYGSGFGSTQTISVSDTAGASSGWYLKPSGADDTWYSGTTFEKDWYYPEDWDIPYDEYPTYDNITGRVVTYMYKSVSWTNNAKTSLSFKKHFDYAYLSLASVENVNITINGSTVGTSTNGKGNVFGGGSIAKVLGDTKIEIINSTIYGTVYGGGDGKTQPGKVDVYDIVSLDKYKMPTYKVDSYEKTSDGSYVPKNVSVTNQSPSVSSVNKTSYMWSSDKTLLENDGIDTENKLLYSPNTDGLGSVDGNTTIIISDGSVIHKSVYGGGDQGLVTGDTFVNIKDSTIKSSVYAGGNASSVSGNTITVIEGDTVINGNLFGGGNSGVIGTKEKDNSSTTLNIVGGTITGNVYGDGNTSVTYGNTNINIGYNAVSDDTLTKGDIIIGGTIFGGGEANASGSENYDFSFISVTRGTNMLIDGSNHDNFDINGSFFGSGNASSSEGPAIITIKNYGSFSDVKRNISIQRANKVTLDNSYLELKGTIDSTNRWATTLFSLSRIDELIIKNDSELYLENSTNLLTKWTSVDEYDIKSTYDKTDNRLYIYEGNSVKVSKTEDNSIFGEVSGITKLGIYKKENDKILTGIYDFDNPDDSITFSSGVYVIGKTPTDSSIDGFYSNENLEYIKVEPLPSGLASVWQVGETITNVNISLKASSYSVIGKYALAGLLRSVAASEYTIQDVDFSNLNENVKIINPNTIPNSYENTDDANNNIGLEVRMTTGNGWNSKRSFILLSDGGYEGDNSFVTSYTEQTPKVEIYLTNAANFTRTDTFGTVSVLLVGTKQIDELHWNRYMVRLNITVDPEKVSTEGYEAHITTGKKYNLFGTTSAVINQKSAFSVSYSLTGYNDLFTGDITRVLKSDYVLPENTKLTLLDISDNLKPQQYYYKVTKDDVNSSKKEYKLRDFIKMGLIDSSITYDDNTNYYKNNVYNENFIVIVDFSDTTSNEYNTNHTLLLETHSDEGLTTVNNDTITSIIYTVREGTLTYKVYSSSSNTTIGKGESFDISVQASISTEEYKDTTVDEEKFGLKLTLYKKNSNNEYEVLSNNDYKDKKVVIDNKEFYINGDNSIFVKYNDNIINDKRFLSIVSSDDGISSGSYKLKAELYLSYNGIFVKENANCFTEIEFVVKDESYGLNALIDAESRVISSRTGFDQKGNDELTFYLSYESNLVKPNIRFSISRLVDNKYIDIDPKSFMSNANDYSLVGNLEYLLLDNPSNTFSFILKPMIGLDNGLYNIRFKLYDNNKFIGDFSKQLLVIE